ncbi:MAG TPA: L-histidine N(alpha)-methyltransferase [Candidatus Eremiobacteraceae bacterium]|nr:L-histidine N(alpha)-methyltransferase [Candidatus Eremiobacteraceae bacterium]
MPFADDVRAGLTAWPKTLPPKYFYDQLGSTLFEAISLLPEYYLTRAEAKILTAHARDIIASVQPARLIELGSGSAVKTRYLIEAGLRLRGALEYSAIDISQTVLETSAKALQAQYPQLAVRSYQGDYYEGLRMLPRASPHVNTADQRTLALFLGSNIGNFDPPEALRCLRAIRAVLEPGDALLLGTDLKKDRAVLEAAYDDPIGVTAAFDLNILARINRELGGEFELRAFRHHAVYNEAAGRVEMHLVSNVNQVVRIRALSLDVSFAADETIHTESSYKFSPDDLERLAHGAGFDLQRIWTDAAKRFACSLLRCAVPKASVNP